jgi:HK97 family phage major capsid protein
MLTSNVILSRCRRASPCLLLPAHYQEQQNMPITIKGKSDKQLREERAAILTQARDLLSQHEDDWTDDREAQHSAMIEDASTIKAALERRAAQAAAGAGIPEGPIPPEHPLAGLGRDKQDPRMIEVRDRNRRGGDLSYLSVPAGKRGTEEYESAWDKYLRDGARGLNPDQMAALRSDDADKAGYLIASEQFASDLLKEVDDLLYIRQYARTHTVREADSLGIRKRTARAATFAWSSELAVSTEDSTLAFGKKVLTPHAATGLLKVSRDFVRRSTMSADQIVREELAVDAAELLEDGYLTGNGSQQPLGVFTASDDGISTSRDVSTGNTTTAITADGLIEAKYALKSQYRRAGARWLFHRDAVKQLAKLKDGEGRYMWLPGIREGEPDMLLGLPIDESERVPNTFTTGLYVGLLATWRYYEIADALDIEIQVLTELYAATNQIGYIARLKTDGMPTLEEAFVRVKLA